MGRNSQLLKLNKLGISFEFYTLMKGKLLCTFECAFNVGWLCIFMPLAADKILKVIWFETVGCCIL